MGLGLQQMRCKVFVRGLVAGELPTPTPGAWTKLNFSIADLGMSLGAMPNGRADCGASMDTNWAGATSRLLVNTACVPK
jgi:hypothetical protein